MPLVEGIPDRRRLAGALTAGIAHRSNIVAGRLTFADF
jgi:hypothetical protein